MEKQADNEEYKDSPTIIRQYCCSSVEALLPKLTGLFVCPRIKTLKKLADYFGVTVDYFLE